MLNLDEDALICDLAETYSIYDYRSLPLSLVATLSAGLRENSRIIMKMCGIPATQETLMLAGIADRIDAFRFGFTDGKEKPTSMVKALFDSINEDKKVSLKTRFRTLEDFEEAWKE